MIIKQGVRFMRQSRRKAAICFALAGLLCCAPAFAFADTEGHPAEADIDRAVRQGWLSCGTGDRFSPDAALTRGMFVTALAKLDDAELPPAGRIFLLCNFGKIMLCRCHFSLLRKRIMPKR